MLDKLKDIVPEVDETKANLIYQKAHKPKFSFNFNFKFKWVLRVVAFLVVLVPVIVIASLGNNHKAEAPNVDFEPTIEEPGCVPEQGEANDESIELFNSNFSDGVLKLVFNNYYKVYYIKECIGYGINSVKQNNEQISMVDNVYKVNALSNVEILFTNNIDKVLISISVDGVNYKDYTFYNK